jgi:hypothetical protein
MIIMNILTKLYADIRRYGEILSDMSWKDGKVNMRAMLIKYDGINYDITLANGEVVGIITNVLSRF